MNRRCAQCGETKPMESFGLEKARPGGRAVTCKACRNQRAKDRRASDPRGVRDRHLRLAYGVTIEQYEQVLADQRGRCAICQTDRPGGNGGENFHVDHDHRSGRLRGLLCAACNLGLAHFKEDPTVINSAIWYLRDPTPEAFKVAS